MLVLYLGIRRPRIHYPFVGGNGDCTHSWWSISLVSELALREHQQILSGWLSIFDWQRMVAVALFLIGEVIASIITISNHSFVS